MIRHPLAALLFFWATGAAALQAPEPAASATQQQARETRRTELRSALLQGRQEDHKAPAADDTRSSGRQLSPGERAHLRQQLRQRQPDPGKPGP